MQTVLRACTRLHELNLARTRITIDTLSVIASDCPHLETLNLSGCDGVTDGGLTALSRGQLRDTLAHLDLTACKQITDAGVRTVVSKCHALETLLLRWSTATPDIFAHAVEQCPRLIRATPAGPFDVALSSACHADADRAARVRINVRCDRCSTVLFGSLLACEVVVHESERPLFKTEVYTDTAPSLSDLADVSHIFARDPCTMRNCPKFVHQHDVDFCLILTHAILKYAHLNRTSTPTCLQQLPLQFPDSLLAGGLWIGLCGPQGEKAQDRLWPQLRAHRVDAKPARRRDRCGPRWMDAWPTRASPVKIGSHCRYPRSPRPGLVRGWPVQLAPLAVAAPHARREHGMQLKILRRHFQSVR